jgi:transposase InsO family protein
MLRNGHVRFGGRAAETDRLKGRHRAAARPNTYVPTWAGMVNVAFIFHVFSRMIVGWRAARSMRTDLVLDTLEMALWRRQRDGITDLAGLVHHADAGSQPSMAPGSD